VGGTEGRHVLVAQGWSESATSLTARNRKTAVGGVDGGPPMPGITLMWECRRPRPFGVTTTGQVFVVRNVRDDTAPTHVEFLVREIQD
jgi:hypothetical protein